ncbi:MAG: hypothetical protein ACR2FM_05585 [Candidatus Saccharimonadales bacterium]
MNSREVNLPRTESAFGDLSADLRYGYGEHVNPTLVAGDDVVIELGAEPFDPNVHDMTDIDQTLIEGLMTDRPHVPVGLASRPLKVSLIQDKMTRQEHSLIGKQKIGLSDMLAQSIELALPNTDPVTGTIVTDQIVDRHDLRHIAKANNRPDGVKQIEWLAVSGLSVVISDFQNMEFAPGSLRDVIAIKLNHLIERTVPRNIGMLALGGGVELNTANRREVKAYNKLLDREHEKVMSALQAAGARVVPVAIDGRIKPHSFNVSAADSLLAKAIEASAR